MTTTSTASQYRVLGCNDEQTECDHCGRRGLKKTVILMHLDDGEIVRFGTSCAVRAQAVRGAHTAALLERAIIAADNEINKARYGYEATVAVLTDPARFDANFARASYRLSAGEFRAQIERNRDEAAAKLASYGILV